MTRIYFLIVVLSITGCWQKSPQTAAASTEENISIQFVSHAIHTPVSVTCSLFDLAFSKPEKLIINKESNDYKIFDSLMKMFTVDNSINGIDTRIKINIITDTICLDIFGN